MALDNGINLRQTYSRKSKRSYLMQNRYRHARQMRRKTREIKKIKNYFGRVLRDLDRKTKHLENRSRFQELLDLGYRLYNQKTTDKNKLYSLHAPEVECISKGKVHKKYEFGCKSSYVTSSKGNLILGALAIHNNPYDGHTLKKAIDQVRQLLPPTVNIETAFVDKGYRGAKVAGIDVHVCGEKTKNKSALRYWLKRRSAIEPIIGHMKNDGNTSRNHLLGHEGDKMYAILVAGGFNLRKCLRVFSFYLFFAISYLIKYLKKRFYSFDLVQATA